MKRGGGARCPGLLSEPDSSPGARDGPASQAPGYASVTLAASLRTRIGERPSLAAKMDRYSLASISQEALSSVHAESRLHSQQEQLQRRIDAVRDRISSLREFARHQSVELDEVEEFSRLQRVLEDAPSLARPTGAASSSQGSGTSERKPWVDPTPPARETLPQRRDLEEEAVGSGRHGRQGSDGAGGVV